MYGYVRLFAIKHTITIPTDIIKIILFFYAPWNKLVAHKIPLIQDKLISIKNHIWYSTSYAYGEEKGMGKYDCQSDKISTIIKYPANIRPHNHTCCKYKNNIYIINGAKSEIILFNPSTASFTKKLDIPNLGHHASCITFNDFIHIFHGKQNKKHIIYSIADNTINIFDDTTTATYLSSVCVLKYGDRIIKFGGTDALCQTEVNTFWISSEIKGNEGGDIEWTLKPKYKVPNSVLGCGYVLYKHFILIFGGKIKSAVYSDNIYILDLKNDIGWIKIKHIKCPLCSVYRAVLDEENNVHLFSRINKWPNWQDSVVEHYSIPIKQILA